MPFAWRTVVIHIVNGKCASPIPQSAKKIIERHCKTSNRNEERNVVSVRKPSEYIHFYTSF
nr:MAG TPA: hypothetical protein [Caudoviricetes sp.]